MQIRKGGRDSLHKWLIEERRHALVKSARSDFASFFRRTYRLPHGDWSSLSHRHFDFVIRCKKLQEDFGRTLELLGIEQKRPLPWVNEMPGKSKDFVSYNTPEIVAQARWAFAPYMQEWGYGFPVAWGSKSVDWLSYLDYRSLALISSV